MFSYSEYRNIIKLVESYLPITDFKEVLDYKPSVFCVLRHDIEFSVDRALKLARIESDELGVKSTYTVQLRNNTYNALSQKNIEAIQEIKKLGHSIGLHQNPPQMEDDELIDYILKDIETLEHYYDFEVDRFAFHRCGSNPEIPEKIDVHYLADSNHKWKYGHPMYIDYKKYPYRMQLLTHPYSWTENGYENMNNFSKLIRARTDELVNDMNSETNTFPKELLS